MAFNYKPLCLHSPSGYSTCAAPRLQTFSAQYGAHELCYSDGFGLEVVCSYLENKWWIVNSKHQPYLPTLILNSKDANQKWSPLVRSVL